MAIYFLAILLRESQGSLEDFKMEKKKLRKKIKKTRVVIIQVPAILTERKKDFLITIPESKLDLCLEVDDD